MITTIPPTAMWCTALIRRFHEAKVNGVKERHLLGRGSPLREFLYVGRPRQPVRLPDE